MNVGAVTFRTFSSMTNYTSNNRKNTAVPSFTQKKHAEKSYDRYDTSDERIQVLTGQLKEYREKNKQLSEQNQSLKQRNKELKEQYSDLQAKYYLLQSEIFADPYYY